MNQIYIKIKTIIEKYDYLYILVKILRDYGFYIFNRISNYQLEKVKFYKSLGYSLNLKNPRSFNEKIFWKKVYDRNPLLPVTADKYLIRSYIKKVLGEDIAKNILVPLLYVTDRPETIPFEKLSLPYIIKPNHTSGLKIIVENKIFDRRRIVKTCKKWLRIPYGMEKMEWAYQAIKRKIVIEKLLQDKDGNNPCEFKFHMFHGKCKLIYVILDRLNDSNRMYYDEKWNYLSVKKKNRAQGKSIDKPINYEMMLEIAEKLSEPFDYVRVDVYSVDDKIYFGELTHYPVSGKLILEPSSFDFEMGKYWNVKSKYWEAEKV